MISKYFLQDCFEKPRNRTHVELDYISDLIQTVLDSETDPVDTLAYFILEVADRACADGAKLIQKETPSDEH